MSRTSEFPTIDVLGIQFYFGSTKTFWTWFKKIYSIMKVYLWCSPKTFVIGNSRVYCFVHPIFCFSFLVTFDHGDTKI